MKIKRRSQAERVAEYLGQDIADVRDSEYHPGKSAVKIFAPGYDYFCSPNKGAKPPASRTWRQVAMIYELPVYRASGAEI